MNIKGDWLTKPLRLVGNLEATLHDILESVTWGKAGKQYILSMPDIEHWFTDLPTNIKKKTAFGVVVRVYETGNEAIRIFQGVFDKKENCLCTRQLIVAELADDLMQKLDENDMLLFATPKFVSEQ